MRRPGQWAAPVHEITTGEDGIDASLALVGLRGHLRLLLGPVRANRPWRLVPHLASASAAAAATAAFGLFYSSIWNMADALSEEAVRQATYSRRERERRARDRATTAAQSGRSEYTSRGD
ncbi:hypothetical protein [Streptomyces sp. MN13]